jgi:hypothetical protein
MRTCPNFAEDKLVPRARIPELHPTVGRSSVLLTAQRDLTGGSAPFRNSFWAAPNPRFIHARVVSAVLPVEHPRIRVARI